MSIPRHLVAQSQLTFVAPVFRPHVFVPLHQKPDAGPPPQIEPYITHQEWKKKVVLIPPRKAIPPPATTSKLGKERVHFVPPSFLFHPIWFLPPLLPPSLSSLCLSSLFGVEFTHSLTYVPSSRKGCNCDFTVYRYVYVSGAAAACSG